MVIACGLWGKVECNYPHSTLRALYFYLMSTGDRRAGQVLAKAGPCSTFTVCNWLHGGIATCSHSEWRRYVWLQSAMGRICTRRLADPEEHTTMNGTFTCYSVTKWVMETQAQARAGASPMMGGRRCRCSSLGCSTGSPAHAGQAAAHQSTANTPP